MNTHSTGRDASVDDTIDEIFERLFDLINLSMNDLLVIVDKKYKNASNTIKTKNRKFPQWLNNLIFWPLTIVYALYVRLPLLLLGHMGRHIVLFIQAACHRSSLTSRLVLHVAALCKIAIMILEKVVSTKFSDIIASVVQTILEYFRISNARKNSMVKKAQSITQLVELLEYKEYEDGNEGKEVSSTNRSRISPRNRSRLATNPFLARVRISNSNTPVLRNKEEDTTGSSWSIQSYLNADVDRSPSYPDSPSSFPGSPDARARHMSVSDVEVDSVVFRVRDKLRLETQTYSTDALSRKAASNVLEAGRNIAFDAHFSLTDTFLACGNHYILKTGSGGSCSTCRASVPVWHGVNVYLEFSITSQSEINPSSFVSGPVDLSIGLIPADCPPNVTAGQWPHSLGLSSDGKLFVSGTECQYKHNIDSEEGEKGDTPLVQVTASTTIGMLIYIPNTHTREEGNKEVDRMSSNFSTVDLDLDDIDSLAMEEEPGYDAIGQSDRDVSIVTDTDLSHQSRGRAVARDFSVTYNINGNVIVMNENSQRSIADSFKNWRTSAPELYAVVSLISKNAGSWCRFSASDVVYKSRSAIGAKAGELVYCLDGSLLLERGSS